MSFYNKLDQFGEKIAILQDNGESISYREIVHSLDLFIKKIKTRKALVFIFCTNSKESIIGYLSCLRSGHVPLLIDSSINQNLANQLIDTYRPNYIWAPNSYYDTMPEINIGRYSLWHLSEVQHHIYSELALLLTTSGSTGSPKLVRLSYQNLEVNARSIVEYLELNETERPITTLPMNYTYGLSIINSHLEVGATLLLTNHTVMQKEFWSFFKEKGATSFGGVPYTFEMLKKLRFFRMHLPSLRTITQAGGKLNRELTKEYAEYCVSKGIRFLVMYGQTEATARMAYLPHQYALEKCGSMGIPIPGGKFNLIDLDGQKITEPDVTGELVYEGDNVSLGYALKLDDLALGDENNGRLITGDMAKRDIDGFYYIVGRKKRFLKIFGSRVNLDEVEQIIRNRGYECACTGTDDHLVVALTEPQAVKAVQELLPAVLGFHKSAIRVVYLSEIPKNESGKISYTQLLEKLI